MGVKVEERPITGMFESGVHAGAGEICDKQISGTLQAVGGDDLSMSSPACTIVGSTTGVEGSRDVPSRSKPSTLNLSGGLTTMHVGEEGVDITTAPVVTHNTRGDVTSKDSQSPNITGGYGGTAVQTVQSDCVVSSVSGSGESSVVADAGGGGEAKGEMVPGLDMVPTVVRGAVHIEGEGVTARFNSRDAN